MQHLEDSCVVRRLFKSLGFKGLKNDYAWGMGKNEAGGIWYLVTGIYT